MAPSQDCAVIEKQKMCILVCLLAMARLFHPSDLLHTPEAVLRQARLIRIAYERLQTGFTSHTTIQAH